MVSERFPDVRLFRNDENVGFARANNQALAETRGDLVLLLNSDTEVRTGALATLAEFMAEHPRAGAVGPRLLNGDGSLQLSCHPMLTPEREFWRLSFLDRIAPRATYRMEHWRTDEPRQVEVIKGACLMLRREALDQIGPLDEGYFMYTEEVDLCHRLAQAGWELWWEPRAEVVHYGEASTRQAAERMYLQLYRSKVQFYRKFGGERQAVRYKRLVRIAYWPRAVLSPRKQVYRRLLAELGEM
jgi:GT2 family glycosyltransferase